jgi:hypothetical protein
MFHCHVSSHGDNGMMTALVYDGLTLPTGYGQQHGLSPPPAHEHPASPVSVEAVSSSPEAGDANVAVLDNRLEPGLLTVPIGTTVAWKIRETICTPRRPSTGSGMPARCAQES